MNQGLLVTILIVVGVAAVGGGVYGIKQWGWWQHDSEKKEETIDVISKQRDIANTPNATRDELLELMLNGDL